MEEKSACDECACIGQKRDNVKNRDCQDPQAVVSIKSKWVIDYLSTIEFSATTVIPKASKCTNENHIGMYQDPIDICLSWYGWVYTFNYDSTTGLSSLLIAQLHFHVDK